MPSISTSTILRAPGMIAFDGGIFYPEAAITVRLIEEKFPVKADGFPTLDERPKDRRYEITLKPVGEWEHLALLFPHAQTAIGTALFDNTPLTIWTRQSTANKFVFSNVAVTKMPTITAGVGFTLLGDMTFTALLKDGADPTASDAYMVISDDTYPGDTAMSVSAIKTPTYAHSWGADPWDSFQVSDKGVVFDFGLELSPQKSANLGTVQMILANRTATAKFTPQGLTVAQIMSAVGSNLALGSTPTVNPLNVSGTGVYLRVYNALLKESSNVYHSTTDMIGELTAMATQTFTDGAANPLFYVGTSAPA